MGARLLQPSFGGGEYAPSLYGRQDLARYGTSGRQIANWIVRPTGGIDTRPGTVFCAATKSGAIVSRLIPFIVSETLAYVVELGHLYARFYYRGALLTSGGVPIEVVTPWTSDALRSDTTEVWALRFTQSADTLFAAHGAHPIQMVKRTGSASFAVSQFVPREGPFRSLNSNSALLMAASSATGAIVLSTNFDLFTANMIGSLVYLEPQALGNIKPWTQGDRGVTVGALRRSDDKVYRATTVPSPPVGALNFTQTGNVRPVHELGREWDGPATSATVDTVTYITGIEWEYVHSGYGIAEITGYTNARAVTAVVRKTLPPDIVGGLGSPGGLWTLSGDGATRIFPIFGATSTSTSSYTVTLAGSPLQADPNYTPPGSNTGAGGSTGSSYNEDGVPRYVP
jgi:hypothetical protein